MVINKRVLIVDNYKNIRNDEKDFTAISINHYG